MIKFKIKSKIIFREVEEGDSRRDGRGTQNCQKVKGCPSPISPHDLNCQQN